MHRLVALLLLAGPALAERLTDPATGLSVDPPAGYTASTVQARPPNAANLLVQRRQDSNEGCQLIFTPAPNNARFSQAELNTRAASPVFRDGIMRDLGHIYTFENGQTFSHAGIDGFMTEAMIRPREGIPAEAAATVRTLLVFLDGSRGRTSAICVGNRAGFVQRREEFIAIVRSTTPNAAETGARPGPKP